MSDEDKVLPVHLAQIQVSERLRDDYGEDKEFLELCESIHRVGLLQPIVVTNNDDGSYELHAGERRFSAVRALNAEGKEIPGLAAGYIRATLKGNLTEEQKRIIEFENVRRKDFTYQEKAKFVTRMHELFMARHPGKWNQELSAMALNLSTGTISYYLNLQEAIDKNPEVAKATTMTSAIKRMKRVQDLEVRRLEVQKNSPEKIERAQQMLTLANALDWIKTIEAESIDLIHFDPPWEVGIGDDERGFGHAGFEDSDSELTKITAIAPDLFRVLKEDRFLILWCGIDNAREVLTLFEKAGFNLKYRAHLPIIWHKPDKTSDFTQQRFPEKKIPIHTYETFYYVRKGDAVFQTQSIDVFSEPRPMGEKRIHPTQKPVPLLETIFKLTSLPGETMLDPMAGSGAALVGAYRALRRPIGCELDKNFYEKAITWLAEELG